MSADLLRRAAAKIRERASVATPGPWKPEVDMIGVSIEAHPGTVAEVFDDLTERLPQDGAIGPDANHIALWSPDVADLVAGWLDDTAEDVENGLSPELDPGYINPNSYPVRLARRILGED